MASINFPKEELATIERWREIKAFETQVSNPAMRLLKRQRACD